MPATIEAPRPNTAPRPEEVLPPEVQPIESTPLNARTSIHSRPRTKNPDPDERIFKASGTVVGPEVNKIKPADKDFQRLDLRKKSKHTSALKYIDRLAERTGNMRTIPNPEKPSETIDVPDYTNLHFEQGGDLHVVVQHTEQEKEVHFRTKRTWLPHFYIKENVGTDKHGRPKGGVRFGRYELTERAHSKHGAMRPRREDDAWTIKRDAKYEPDKTTEDVVTIKVVGPDGSVKAIETYNLKGFAAYLRGEGGQGLPDLPAEKAWWPKKEAEPTDRRTIKVDFLSREVAPGKNAKKHLLDVILDKQVREELESVRGLKWIDGDEDCEVLDDAVIKRQLGVGKGFKTERSVYVKRTDSYTGQSTYKLQSMDEFRGYFDVFATDPVKLAGLKTGRPGSGGLGLYFDVPKPPAPEATIPRNDPNRLSQEEAILRLAEQTLGAIYPGPRSNRPTGLTELEEYKRRQEREHVIKQRMGKLGVAGYIRRYEAQFNKQWNMDNIPQPTQAELDKQKQERTALFLLTSAEELSSADRAEKIQQMIGSPIYKEQQERLREALQEREKKLTEDYSHKYGKMDKYERIAAKDKLAAEIAKIEAKTAEIRHNMQLANEGYKLIDGMNKLIEEKGLPEVVEMALRMQREFYTIMKDADLPIEGENEQLAWAFQYLAEQSYYSNTKGTLHNETALYSKDLATSNPAEKIPGMMIGDAFEQTKEGRDRVRQLIDRKVGEEFAKRHIEVNTQLKPAEDLDEEGKRKIIKQIRTQLANDKMRKLPEFVKQPLKKVLERTIGEGKAAVEYEPAEYAAIGALVRRATGKHGRIHAPYYPY